MGKALPESGHTNLLFRLESAYRDYRLMGQVHPGVVAQSGTSTAGEPYPASA